MNMNINMNDVYFILKSTQHSSSRDAVTVRKNTILDDAIVLVSFD